MFLMLWHFCCFSWWISYFKNLIFCSFCLQWLIRTVCFTFWFQGCHFRHLGKDHSDPLKLVFFCYRKNNIFQSALRSFRLWCCDFTLQCSEEKSCWLVHEWKVNIGQIQAQVALPDTVPFHEEMSVCFSSVLFFNSFNTIINKYSFHTIFI